MLAHLRRINLGVRFTEMFNNKADRRDVEETNAKLGLYTPMYKFSDLKKNFVKFPRNKIWCHHKQTLRGFFNFPEQVDMIRLNLCSLLNANHSN